MGLNSWSLGERNHSFRAGSLWWAGHEAHAATLPLPVLTLGLGQAWEDVSPPPPQGPTPLPGVLFPGCGAFVCVYFPGFCVPLSAYRIAI